MTRQIRPALRIMSGGQTGVDRAALDVGLACNAVECGWCPAGRRAEDGPLADRYPLKETPKRDYSQRTRWNVRDSDGTLVLTIGKPDGGTAYTIRVAEELGRPCLVVDLSEEPDTDTVLTWIRENRFRLVNVAGPRESKKPGIYRLARDFLARIMEAYRP